MSERAYVPTVADGPESDAKAQGVRSSAERRLRTPATGAEAVRRKQWGAQWGKAGSDAGKAAREKD